MTITHHPDPSTLMSYAAGSLPEPLAAVVAGHVAMCAKCRRDVATLELVGSTLIDRLPREDVHAAASLDERAGAGLLDPLGDGVLADMPAAASRGEVPAPLARLVGNDLDQVPWRRLGYGVWHCPLPLSRSVRGDLRLFKVAPGCVMPEHGHGGSEMTLMLRGSYSDEFGRFVAGDVADLDEDVEHQPIADAADGCICLVASVGRARFKSLVARIVQPFTGI